MAPVGLTKDVGWVVGVRRVFPGSADEAWRLLLSPAGLKRWVGGSGRMRPEPGRAYRLADGTTGEWRVVKPGEVVRVTWQPPEWPRASLVQVRVVPRAAGRCAVSFHQERLPDAAARAAMKARWTRVLAELGCDA